MLLAGDNLQRPHLSGPPGMHSAAGADVRVLHSDQAHRPGQLLFAPVAHLAPLLLRGPVRRHWKVGPYGLVGQPLQLWEIRRGNLPVKVHCHTVGPHVEAHVFISIELVDNAGQDMLPGVLLHQQQAAGPVHIPFHLSVFLQRGRGDVADLPVPFPHIRNRDAAQNAVVRKLAPSLRIKGGSVQYHLPAVLDLWTGLAGEHPCGKGNHMGILVVEALGFTVGYIHKRMSSSLLGIFLSAMPILP